jgi:hypothetical protein
VVQKVDRKRKVCSVQYDDGDFWDAVPFSTIEDSSNMSNIKCCPQCCVIICKSDGCDAMQCTCGRSFDWQAIPKVPKKVVDGLVELFEKGELDLEIGLDDGGGKGAPDDDETVATATSDPDEDNFDAFFEPAAEAAKTTMEAGGGKWMAAMRAFGWARQVSHDEGHYEDEANEGGRGELAWDPQYIATRWEPLEQRSGVN